MTAFRVFFLDGTTFDCLAKTPLDARKIAASRQDKPILKVKVIREDDE